MVNGIRKATICNRCGAQIPVDEAHWDKSRGVWSTVIDVKRYASRLWSLPSRWHLLSDALREKKHDAVLFFPLGGGHNQFGDFGSERPLCSGWARISPFAGFLLLVTYECLAGFKN
jgi:hypothetical protein